MSNTLAITSICLYLVATVTLFLRLKGSIQSSRKSKTLAVLLGLAALPAHGYLLYLTMVGSLGLNLTFFLMLSLTAWLTNLIVFTGSLWRPIENLALMTAPFAIITLALQLLNQHTNIQHIAVSSGLQFHISISILSYVLLSIAAFQAVLLAIQNHQLRNRRLRGFIQFLPPLETMESLLFEMIVLGYILLSVSLLTGVTYIENVIEQHLVHKTILSVSAWVVFAILIWGRWRFGWRGKIAVRWTLAGFVVLMLAYFGSKMVQEIILGRVVI